MPKSEIYKDEPLKNHTTFKIGGPADFVVMPQSTEEIVNVLSLCRKNDVPYFVLGNGSNLLADDSGYRGVIIKLAKNFSDIKVAGNFITADAGALLSAVANCAYEAGLGNMEFAAGIPGTIGGAVLMNAGAYDGEMKDIVISTEYIDENLNVQETCDHGFGYRTSRFQNMSCVITKTTVRLECREKAKIKEKMSVLAQKRREKQPLNFPSAGSAFKRPEGFFAAKLIDDAGLRGYKIGGAEVSEKHAGFIVNSGGATAADVKKLIEYVQSTVKEKFGVTLEREIKFL